MSCDMDSRTSSVFNWTLEYVCCMFWHEFETRQTVDARTERAFLGGLVQYLHDDRATGRMRFIELLCLLADADDLDVFVADNGVADSLNPLEKALCIIEKILAAVDDAQLIGRLDEMKRLVKIQAVFVLLRKNKPQAAQMLVQKLWPKHTRLTDEDQEAVKCLTEMVGGEEADGSFTDAHTLGHFYESVMPTLRNIYSQFRQPFLLQVLQKTEAMRQQREEELPVISCSHLKKAVGDPRKWTEFVKSSDRVEKEHEEPSSSPRSSSMSDPDIIATESPLRSSVQKRSHASSSDTTQSEEASSIKRGKSIRSLTYGGHSLHHGRLAPSDPTTSGQRIGWEDLEADEREETDDVPAKRNKRLQSKRRPWTPAEEDALRDGVERYGVGKWAEILLSYSFGNRTNVMLKDKWRNMMKSGSV